MDDAAPSEDCGQWPAPDMQRAAGGGVGRMVAVASPDTDAGPVGWPALRSVHGLADEPDGAPAPSAERLIPFFYRRAATPPATEAGVPTAGGGLSATEDGALSTGGGQSAAGADLLAAGAGRLAAGAGPFVAGADPLAAGVGSFAADAGSPAAGAASPLAGAGRPAADTGRPAAGAAPPPADAGRPVTGGWQPGGAGPRSRARFGIALGALAAALLMAGAGIALTVPLLRSGGPSPGAADRPAALTAAVGGRQDMMLNMVNGASTVNLRAAVLGDELYRITTPAAGAVTPQADDLGDSIRLALRPSGSNGPSEVDVLLNAAVRWNLRIGGGTELSVIDMSGGKLDRLDLAAGATRIEVTLPQPAGTLRVRMTGGVNQFLVHTVGPVAVRVRVGAGAGKVVLDGRTHRGVAPGALLTPPGWAKSPDRVDLDVSAGTGSLTVDEI